MTEAWYYAEENKPVGPFGLSELVTALANRQNVENVLVWSKSLGSWRRVEEIPELRGHFIPPPIVLQPAVKAVPDVKAPTGSFSPWCTETGQASASVSPSREATAGYATEVKSGWSVKKFAIGAVSLVVTLIAAAFGGVIGKTGVQALMSPSTVSLQSQLEAAQQKALPQLRADLPKKLDDVTTMVAVDAHDGTIFYSYRINEDRSAYKAIDFITEMRKSIVGSACKESSYVKSLGYGAKYQYSYVDKNGHALGTLLIDKRDCPQSH